MSVDHPDKPGAVIEDVDGMGIGVGNPPVPKGLGNCAGRAFMAVAGRGLGHHHLSRIQLPVIVPHYHYDAHSIAANHSNPYFRLSRTISDCNLDGKILIFYS